MFSCFRGASKLVVKQQNEAKKKIRHVVKLYCGAISDTYLCDRDHPGICSKLCKISG